MSGIIENSIRDVDWCARWFGVEFAVFIDNEEKESAVKILENIKHKIHNKKFGIGELLSVTVSIGVKYIASGETITPDKLTDKAREALIKAQELDTAGETTNTRQIIIKAQELSEENSI